MKTISVETFQKFHNAIQKYDSSTIYRGVSNISYKLLPKVGREKTLKNYNEENLYNVLDDYEQSILEEFQKYAIPFVQKTPESPWEWWAIAQHYGLPTRFLDWTKNPLVALYFAIENCSLEEDAVVYAANSKQFNSNIDLNDTPDPLGISEVYLYYPPHINQRIVVQSGIFTVHNNPQLPLNETEKPSDKIDKRKGEKYSIDKIILKKESKKSLKKVLNLYGINEATIYPGLEGIARHLEWKTLDCNSGGV